MGHSHPAPRSSTAHYPHTSTPHPWPSILSHSPTLPSSDQLATSLEVPGCTSSCTLSTASTHQHISYNPGHAPSQHPSWKAEAAPDFLRPLRPVTMKPRCLLESVAQLCWG